MELILWAIGTVVAFAILTAVLILFLLAQALKETRFDEIGL